MHDVVFFYSSINRGGSELALLRYLKNTNKANNAMLVYFKDTSDLEMIGEFKKVIKVKKLLEGESVDAKTAVNCMISTTENGFFNKIKADKYVLWVQVNPEIYSNYKDFDKYDKFLTTSLYIKDLVLKYPGIDSNNVYLANPLVDFDDIRKKAEQSQCVLKKGTNNLITIARVSHEKGYDYMIEIAKILKNRGIDFKWYMLGFVSKKEEEYYQNIKKIIKKYNLEDNLIFMGAHENPYKYLKHADINVLLSKNEAWGLVITEAKALGIPSITSNNSALKEQIQNGENGFLVDLPQSEKDYEIIADKIQELIENKKLYACMVNKLKTYEYNVQKIVEETDKCFFE